MLPRPARFRKISITQPFARKPLITNTSIRFNRYYASSSSSSSATSDKPLKIAIIGSGPSGFYTASRILNSLPINTPSGENVEVHMYERLPTPYGLVRYGVAPDHPEVKNCQHKFDELSNDPRFQFFGNVLVSSQPSSSSSEINDTPRTALSTYTYPHSNKISFKDLLPYYSNLILTYGASLSNPLSNVSGSSSSSNPLENVFPALGLVSWYNSHPAYENLPINLKGIKEVNIIGQGNVALDVARILLKPIEDLKKTDLSEKVLNELSKSTIKKVNVVGRRGPGQISFTTKEFREMLQIPNLQYNGIDSELMNQAKDFVGNERMKKRLLSLMDKSIKNGNGEKEFKLDFLKSPKTFLPSIEKDSSSNKVGEIEWNLNELLSSSSTITNTPEPPQSQQSAIPTGNIIMARSTGKTLKEKTDMMIESVGYRSEPLSGENNGQDWILPFDEKRGRVKNVNGRVIDEQGVVIPGVYVAGWAARGPVGVIASTMHDSYLLSDLLLQDHFSNSSSTTPQGGPLNSKPLKGMPESLIKSKQQGGIIVDLENWKKIDQAEIKNAKLLNKNKEREKFTNVKDMLSVL
ncbi:uncharacterized protein L201_007639 [Kwoniella dendrophila CBS 6074]|uniref:adrenodoxin-NADP(+) reductase n=1 Tax=Kwoniella dendrophila CBS 6074 TaxID=1295534 RepID=A0AAX4K501_9TREE